MKHRILFSFCICFFLNAFCHAEKISFSADSMNGTAGNTSNATILKGNASVITETMEISADTIELSGKEFRNIKASGNVKGKNTKTKMDFDCGALSYDRDTKVAVLSDNVNLVDVENNVTAKAQIIEYNQDTEIAVMQINVDLKQKDNTCTCAYAVYKKTEQMLTMNGNPKIVQGKDTFRAQTITLNMDTQEINLTGRVKGNVTTEGSSSNSSEAKNE